jgi:hypothetical protein
VSHFDFDEKKLNVLFSSEAEKDKRYYLALEGLVLKPFEFFIAQLSYNLDYDEFYFFQKMT